jgi:hypothetical protein
MDLRRQARALSTTVSTAPVKLPSGSIGLPLAVSVGARS